MTKPRARVEADPSAAIHSMLPKLELAPIRTYLRIFTKVGLPSSTPSATISRSKAIRIMSAAAWATPVIACAMSVRLVCPKIAPQRQRSGLASLRRQRRINGIDFADRRASRPSSRACVAIAVEARFAAVRMGHPALWATRQNPRPPRRARSRKSGASPGYRSEGCQYRPALRADKRHEASDRRQCRARPPARRRGDRKNVAWFRSYGS
jgi:hypothetical protein